MLKHTVSAGRDMQSFQVKDERGCWLGSFAISEWISPEGHSGGEIMANTQYGAYGHHWSSCGQPFKEFLADFKPGDIDYVMSKMTSHDYTEFDGEATINAAKRCLLDDRRQKSLDKETAREVYDSLCDLDPEASADLMCGELSEIEYFQDSYYELAQKRVRSDVRGFYEHVFLPLCSYLKETPK